MPDSNPQSEIRNPQLPPLPASIRKRYQVADEGDKWRLTCRSCRARWRLLKTAAADAGNLLHLLNHAASHRLPLGADSDEALPY